MRSAISIVTSLAVAAALLLAASAPARSSEIRPVVFIPGLMGSTLKNSKNEQVWGSIKDTTDRFEELAFPVDSRGDKLTSTGILDSLSLYLGWVKILAYGPMTDFLKSAAGGKYHAFHYDWRQSNFASACDLVKFIEANRNLADAARSDLGITVVTHSMGGIVGRIFIDYRAPSGTQPTAENPCPHQFNVTLFAPIAAPFNGAGQALRTVTDKVATYWRFIRYDEAQVLRVFMTIPSVYELLPRYGTCCVNVGGSQWVPVDALSYDTWRKNRWLPRQLYGYRPEQIEPFIRGRLAAAKRLQAVVSKPLPADTRLLSLWGVNQKTSTFVQLKPKGEGKKPEADWTDFKDGDDTVPQLSASRCDPAAPKPEPCNYVPDLVEQGLRTWVFPNTHVGLLADPKVHAAISFALKAFGTAVAGPRALTEEVTEADVPAELRPFVLSGATARSLDEQGFAQATFDFPYQHLRAGIDQVVLFTATGADGKPIARADANRMKAFVQAGDGTKIPAVIAVLYQPGQFGVSFRAPPGPDAVSVRIEMPPTGDVVPKAESVFAVDP